MIFQSIPNPKRLIAQFTQILLVICMLRFMALFRKKSRKFLVTKTTGILLTAAVYEHVIFKMTFSSECFMTFLTFE